ncbi:MAG: Ger(x)C family spore germination protein [Limnochordia bacterium]|nr:Ger(x)C family spore germination protein [Limnochordia bacterium]
MRDIEKRANIIAIGIDFAEPEAMESETEKLLQGPAIMYRMTLEIPKLRKLGKEGGGGGDDGFTWVLSSTGTSLGQISSLLDHRIWRSPFYGHTKAVIIGEELAREGIKDVIDYLHRHRDISRRMKLLISNGKAKDVLEVKPAIEPLLGVYLDNLIEFVTLSGRVQTKSFGEVVQELVETGNALLPRVRPAEDEAVVGGSAVIKNWQLVGWLGEVETAATVLVQNRIKGGTVIVGNRAEATGEVSYFLRTAKTSIKASQGNGQAIFRLDIQVEGDIIEQIGGGSLMDQQLLSSIEKMVNERLRGLVLDVIRKLQSEFRVDVLGFGRALSKQLPEFYLQVKDQWDDVYFPEASFQVTVEAKIRRIGVVD